MDGSEDGERWNLPIHLLDAIFFAQTGKVCVYEGRGIALDILRRLSAAINMGISKKHLQRLPHITLLNYDFYHEVLKPIIAEWLFLWLQNQHLHGIEHSETLSYIMEGAIARSYIKAKVNIIEDALVKCTNIGHEEKTHSEYNVKYLQEAKLISEDHCALMNKIYDIDTKIEESAKASSQIVNDIQNTITELQKELTELECPRGKSMHRFKCVIVY